MNTSNIGQQAEGAATQHLQGQGFKIITRNYRTPRCEIDIIAQKDDCIYFVEVKYRASGNQGSGLDYVTLAKQKQMQFAAYLWTSEHDWAGEISLAAIEVSGADFQVDSFIESILGY